MIIPAISAKNNSSFGWLKERKLRNSSNNRITEAIDDRIKNLDTDTLRLWRERPFWNKEHNKDGTCCFIDLVGRPIKAGVECPLYPFEDVFSQPVNNTSSLRDSEYKSKYTNAVDGYFPINER